MTRWLRREALAVVLVLVLGAASVAWTLRQDWAPYQRSLPTDLTRAAAGEQGRFHGTGFTVTGTRVVAGDGDRGGRLGLAPDAALLVVTLAVEPDPDPDQALPTCELDLVEDRGGGTRWDPAGFGDVDYSVPDRYESYCDTEATAPYALQVAFVLPATVTDGDLADLEVEVSSFSLVPEALRLRLGAPQRS